MRDLVGRVFFALQDTRTPLMLGLATVGINVVGNFLLVGPLEQGGLALATTIANGFGLVGGILWLHKKVPGGLPTARVAVSVTRTWLSSAVMGLVLFVLSTFMLMSAGPMNTLTFLARALALIVIGLVVYLGMAWILRVPELSLVRRSLLRLVGR